MPKQLLQMFGNSVLIIYHKFGRLHCIKLTTSERPKIFEVKVINVLKQPPSNASAGHKQ